MTRIFFTISKPLIILSFLFFFGEVHSQNRTWFKVYDGPGNWNDAGNAICKADGNNFFVAGYSFVNGNKIYLLKINENGDTLFSKIIGQQTQQKANSIIPDNNSNFYVTGDGTKSFVIKININGVVLWEKYYEPTSAAKIDGSKLMSDNTLVICGRVGSYSGYIQKTDSAGTLLWNKIVSGSFYKDFTSLEEDSNGNIVLIGGDGTNNYITKYSSAGNFIYEKRIDGNSTAIKIKKIKGAYFVANLNFTITKLDTSGAFLSSKNFQYSGRTEGLRDFQVINDSKFIMCGFSNPDSDTAFGKILIADSAGSILNSRLVPCIYDFDFRALQITQGGDILFTGYRTIPIHEDDDMIIMRTNQNLEGPSVGINNNSIVTNSFQLFQNYPNPFNPSTIIQFNIPENGIVNLKVYNSAGKEVYTSKKYFNTGTNQFEYSAENLSSGVYFYSLQFQEMIQTRKMIFVK